VVTIRRFREQDAHTLWALNDLPNIGATADTTVPLPLPPAAHPPSAFPDLADIAVSFLEAGGDFLVAELDDQLVGMGGIRPDADRRAHVLRVRVHPATRRLGIGKALMTTLEQRASQLGMHHMFLDTATNQPEAMAFYQSLGYHEIGRQHEPSWSWTLVYYSKPLNPIRQ
jgi:ribosomal protein S18 acetylase RimI-like enzyme